MGFLEGWNNPFQASETTKNQGILQYSYYCAGFQNALFRKPEPKLNTFMTCIKVLKKTSDFQKAVLLKCCKTMTILTDLIMSDILKSLG